MVSRKKIKQNKSHRRRKRKSGDLLQQPTIGQKPCPPKLADVAMEAARDSDGGERESHPAIFRCGWWRAPAAAMPAMLVA